MCMSFKFCSDSLQLFLSFCRWKSFLLTLSYQVVELISPMVLKRTDSLNPLDFVHVKKLHSYRSKLPSYEVIRGVAFTQSLQHSSMPATMRNVSVMLLTGNISYERVVEKFSSLETVLLQEQEYLKIQVERVSSRRVTLLLVEGSVAKAASDMLLDENIALVANVRRKVLERIST